MARNLIKGLDKGSHFLVIGRLDIRGGFELNTVCE